MDKLLKAPKGVLIGGACGVVAVVVIIAGFATGLFGGGHDKANVLADNIPIVNGRLDAGATFTVAGEQGDYWTTTIDGKTVYIAKANAVTDSEKAAAEAAAKNKSTKKKSSSSSSSSGGTQQQSQPDSSSSQDGGEISLTAATEEILKLFVPEKAYAAEVGENATVLDGGADIVIGFVNRGDEVEILATLEDGTVKIAINGLEGYVKASVVRGANEKAPEAKDAFAGNGSAIYSDVNLTNKVRDLTANETVHIVDTIGNVAVVEIDGGTYYMATEQTSDTQVEVPVVTKKKSSSSKSSSSSSSGSSSSGSTSSGPEWTEEVL